MNIISFISNLLMPERCLFCSEITGFLPKCNKCSEDLLYLTRECGSEIELSGKSTNNIKLMLAPFIYDGCVRDGIVSMKFQFHADKSKKFAFYMQQELKACKLEEKFDIIIAVPSTKKAIRKRGYDIAHLLARELSHLTSVSYAQNALIKKYNTKKQATLSAQKRQSNLIGAFDINNKIALAGKRVLLVDDIITTGSTLNECAKELLLAQVKEVVTICIAATPQCSIKG